MCWLYKVCVFIILQLELHRTLQDKIKKQMHSLLYIIYADATLPVLKFNPTLWVFRFPKAIYYWKRKLTDTTITILATNGILSTWILQNIGPNIATLFNAIGKHMNYTNADWKRKWTVLGECLLGHLRVIGHDFYFFFFSLFRPHQL